MRRITTPSFKDVEGERKLTLPNAMSVLRGLGGVGLGAGMAAHVVDPTTATAVAALLAATDAEGSVIQATKRFPRLQRAILALPSRWGRILDPVADKVYAISIFAGGMANGAIPLEQGAAVLGTEFATMGATQVATNRRGGEVPETGQVNKLGMIARIEMIAADLGAHATQGAGAVHDALTVAGEAGFVAAVGFGIGSFVHIYRQGNEVVPEPPIQ